MSDNPEQVFEPVDTKQRFTEVEESILDFWKRERIFDKTIRHRADGPLFRFYEGPPTANGKPGTHHILARVFKDIFLRFKTMRGYNVPRRAGWDTQGLPVEIEIEKQLGLDGKGAIEAYGVDKFNAACRASVHTYLKDWEKLTERIAFWLDLGAAYYTYTNDYVESCWALLRKLWDRELIFQGYKVTMHCPRCGTSLADHEVSQGFEDDVDDPSVWVRLRLVPDQELPFGDAAPRVDEEMYFVIWTTTPWTLPANAAVALNADADYVLAELDGKRHIVVKEGVERTLGEEATVVASAKGADLAGLRYEPLYNPVDGTGKLLGSSKTAHRSIVDETVSTADGTGIVHIAPAYGDLEVGDRHKLPVLFSVDLDGKVLGAFGAFAGKFFKDADKDIIRDLKKRGHMVRAGRVKHSYPFCWRCKTPLLYFAKTSWYIQTSAFKDRMLALNDTINWVPPFVGERRFGDWLRGNVDWALSRERYWGTPLPFWKCDKGDHVQCIGSFAELADKSGHKLDEDFDPHRPYVDDLKIPCDRCDGTASRVPEVADAWFDSGAMPYAQDHYPFNNRDRFRESFPSDFICEAVDQTRGWFYSLHALATLSEDSVAYKNCLVLGHILDANGLKMSKSKGNVVEPWSVLDSQGCDALRWYFYSASSPWQPRRFSADLVARSVRSFLLPLWNVYAFYVNYGNLELHKLGEGPLPGSGKPAVAVADRPEIDRWLVSRTHALVREVTAELEAYDVTTAARSIESFVDELSAWYVRRNRDRFWRRVESSSEEANRDKLAAYATLGETLVTLSKLLAPFMPFLSDAMYRNLVVRGDADAVESVHLADWPQAKETLIDETLLKQVAIAQQVVTAGRSVRAAHELKVRQPLQKVIVGSSDPEVPEALRRFEREILAELNVEELEIADAETRLVNYSVRADIGKLGPKLRKRLPAVRKAVLAMDPAELAPRVLAGQAITVSTPDGDVELAADELEVLTEAAPGLATAEEGNVVVALSTEITPELRAKGIAREVVRHVQDMRKTLDLPMNQEIATRYSLQATEGDVAVTLQDAIAAHRDYIAGETLSGSFEETTEGNPTGAGETSFELPEGRIHAAIEPVTD